MRVLLITDRLPFPIDSGAALRTNSLLIRMAKRHEMWLMGYADDTDHNGTVGSLAAHCREVVAIRSRPFRALSDPRRFMTYLARGIPPDLRAYVSAELAVQTHRLASRVDFDVVQIEHSHMGLTLEFLPKRLRRRAIWVLHDIDWAKFAQIASMEPKPARRLRLMLHSALMRHWVPRQAERFGLTVTVSELDRRLLLAANPGLTVEVVENGVDTKSLMPLEPHRSTPVLLFVGDLRYRPNADGVIRFAADTFPRIERDVVGVQLWIVGKDPPGEVRGLASDRVKVLGPVENLLEVYAGCTACVIPLRAGGGTRLKILEAMALGKPIVTTSVGCQGLQVVDGEHLLVADEPEAFAKKTVLLLTEDQRARELTDAARRLVVKKYDWDIVASQLDRAYTRVRA